MARFVRPLTFCLTVNLHGTSVELRQVPPAKLLGRYAYGKYLAIGTERILRLLADRGIRATFFTPALEAELNPGLVREIVSEGHEIAANGYALEDHLALGDREIDTLRKAHDALSEITGAAPRGWRAPDGFVSDQTIRHLKALGYLYDSSFQDDDHPYGLDDDGGPGMIELPQNEILIDQTLFAIRQTHDRVMKNWIEEFQGQFLEGCFTCMTLHPRPDYGVGRASRMVLVDQFLRHVCAIEGSVEFLTCAEAAHRAVRVS